MENKGRKEDDRTLSRRNFLKAVGLGSASLALGGLEPGASFGQGQDRYMFTSAYEQNSADPAGHMDVGRSPTRMNFYDGLMRWRDNPPQLTPNIALSYEVSKDALKWTFKLRKDALFHDGPR